MALAHSQDAWSFYASFKIQTYRELGILLGAFHPNGHGGRPYDKSHIKRILFGERLITADALVAFQRLAEAVLRARSDGRVGVRAVFGARRWKFKAVAVCGSCTREFSPCRLDQVKCLRCLRK